MKRLISLSIFFFFGAAHTAMAQAPGMGMGMGTSPRDIQFYQTVPDIGGLVPDIEVVDDQGNPVNIREVATGQYTVLVLGCLT